MLDDRSYMREPGGAPTRTLAAPLWLVLVVVNVLMYGAQELAPAALDRLVLVPVELARGHVWQLLTFQFLHGGLFHLVINCAMIWMFGRTLELQLGRGRFLGLYLCSGVMGGLLQCAVPWILGDAQALGVGVVGASAGIFGLLAAFALLHWEQELTLLLLFIIPVTMRAKWMLLVLAVIGALGMLDRSSGIGHAAHLGGMMGGIWFTAQFVLSPHEDEPRWLGWLRFTWRARKSRKGRKIIPCDEVLVPAGIKKATGVFSASADGPEDSIHQEVDLILDKISEQGIGSLTEQERKTLERARSQMGR